MFVLLISLHILSCHVYILLPISMYIGAPVFVQLTVDNVKPGAVVTCLSTAPY